MTRPILLSNGSLHVGLNIFGMVHDFYYPYVGLENHSTAHRMRHRIGVWVNNEYSWLDDGTWQISMDYLPHAMVGITKAHHEKLQVTLEFEDCVDVERPAFLRNIHVVNAADHPREIRLFMHQVFLISNSLSGDTAQYLPGEPALLHYKGHRAFIISGKGQGGRDFDQFSVGVYGIEGKEGTYKDAEDGQLSGNAVEHGSVDSVIAFHVHLGAHDSGRVNYWIACGETQRSALTTHRCVKNDSLFLRQEEAADYWRYWLQPAERFLPHLRPENREPFRKSLLIIKSHIDKHGAVIASTDTSMLNYSRDAYGYCWPRDGAYALWPLLRLGYHSEVRQFFIFCRNVLHPDGFLMHKYQADGALGSSWHPYVYAGVPQPPIQEDETAIVVFMLGQYFEITQHRDLIDEFYPSLVLPMAGFLANYIDHSTKLPHASYDLWEEKFLTSTYTTGVTYAALIAASKLAELVGDQDNAVRWQTTADDMREAAHAKLFNEEQGFFYKGYLRKGAKLVYDTTIDMSSFYGAFMFGLFDLQGEHMTKAFDTLEKTFNIAKVGVTPMPRYLGDKYNTVDLTGPGNPWFVTTLWLAQYYMEVNELERAQEIIAWVRSQMMPSGILPEQINPYTKQFVSVAPLVWSQAEFMNTLLDLSSDLKQPKDRQEADKQP